MIHFFRRIRQNLLSGGKTGKAAWPIGKYLTYAIGEIILVMIGILLALQVNNWNEQRKETQRLNEMTRVLTTDLKNKIEENKGDRTTSEMILFQTDTLIAVWEKTNKIDTTYLKSVLNLMGADFGYTSGISPVNQTLSNSNLWEKLPDTLISRFDWFYKGSVEGTKVSFQNYSKYAYENKINFLMPNNLINLDRPASEILISLNGQEEIFIRRLELTKHSTKILNERFSGLIDSGEEIIEMLEDYLKTHEK